MAMIDEILSEVPQAYAEVKGSDKYPDIQGWVYFYGANGGTIVLAEIYGLPDEEQQYLGRFFGFHIHEGSTCTGNRTDPFADTLIHYSPGYVQHPQHAGDLPVLLSFYGMAWMVVYTGRFRPQQVVGRTVVIHSQPDDYRTQPHGNAGEKMACGEIKEWGSQLSVNLIGI